MTTDNITDEMVAAGAKALTARSGDIYSVQVRDSMVAIRVAEQVLRAALAGYTVTREPASQCDAIVPSDPGHGDFTASACGADVRVVQRCTRGHELASESSGGETHG